MQIKIKICSTKTSPNSQKPVCTCSRSGSFFFLSLTWPNLIQFICKKSVNQTKCCYLLTHFVLILRKISFMSSIQTYTLDSVSGYPFTMGLSFKIHVFKSISLTQSITVYGKSEQCKNEADWLDTCTSNGLWSD